MPIRMNPNEGVLGEQSGPAKHRGVAYLCRGIAAIAAVLLLSEAGLRWGVGLGRSVLYVEDSSAGYVLAPNQSVWRFNAHISTNSFGMRSDPISASKPPGTHRILFVGDSVTFGTTHVDQSEIFTVRIKNWFAHRQPTEILNASAGGWAPANELGYLKSRGIFGSDLVVLTLNTNDLAQPMAVWKTAPAISHQKPVVRAGRVMGSLSRAEAARHRRRCRSGRHRAGRSDYRADREAIE